MPESKYRRGEGADALPQGSAAQLNQQLAEADAMRDARFDSIEQLQGALASGEITQDDYFAEIETLHDAELGNLAGDLAEQGKTEAAGAAIEQVLDDGPPQGVQFDTSPEPSGNQRFPDEADNILYGPSNSPDKPITAGRAFKRVPPPRDTDGWLPFLVEASKDPDAPPQLRQLLKLLNFHLSR